MHNQSKNSINVNQQIKSALQTDDIIQGSLTINFSSLSSNRKEQIISAYLLKKKKTKPLTFKGINQNLYKYVKKSQDQKISLRYRLIQNQSQTQQQNHTNILKNILHIKFQNLTHLLLNELSLSNIQNLIFLIAPKLKCLQLYNNNLVSITPLHKSNFLQLETISLYENHIYQIKKLTRGHFSHLQNYQLDSFYNLNTFKVEYVINDFTFLFKMDNTFIKKLYAQSPQHIYLKKAEQILRKLNPHANLKLPLSPLQVLKSKKLRLRD